MLLLPLFMLTSWGSNCGDMICQHSECCVPVSIFEKVLHRHRTETCYGCQVEAPGQLEHNCLHE